MHLTPGQRIGPYEVVGSLGAGGMGEVYRAWDARLQRPVAIKTLSSQVLARDDFRARFDREARAVAALSHPNILAIYDVGSHAGIPYIAIEYLEGETLRSRIGTSPLPLSTVLDYAVQIGRGLAAAHDRGIIHRDLKPENVFVTRDGQIKILDFGIATEPAGAADDEATRPATEHGVLLGTAGYMSPEQARGERADARSDLFSFGCVLYEMLTGRRAFAGDSRVETLHAILKTHPPDLTGLRHDVPLTLDRLVRRCLEKAPESRFQSARDLVFALESLAGDPGQRTDSSMPRSKPRPAIMWAAATILTGAALLGAGTLWWTARRHAPARQQERTVSAGDERRRLLAVLPFENIGRDRDGYFAAGMTEEVTGQLSKLSALRVVSRTAVANFKNARADLPVMARELGIGSVVTGTVREDGPRVRVNVELIEAPSGQVIWSDQYDRTGVDVFAAQSDIALRVAEALNASVTLEEQARIGKRPTSSVAAYELFVRAQNVRGKTSEERLNSSLELLRQAVAIDPRFAEAYSQIASASYLQAAYGDLTALPRGFDAAHKALEIDPQLASAHHVLALNLHQFGRLGEALPAYRKAVELDPNYTGGLLDLGFGESTAGHFDQALKHTTLALELVPNTAIPYYHVGVALLCLDDDARTEKFLTMASTRFPTAMRLQVLLAIYDLRRGRSQAALERIRHAADTAPGNIEVLLTRAEVATFAGALDAPEIVSSLFQRTADGLFHSAPYPVKLAHAYYLGRGGDTARAGKLFDEILAANQKALTAGADWPMVFMQNAAVHALRGEPTAALDELDRAYQAGWRDGRLLAIDPFFESVRSEPRFRDMLSRIEADVAAMRARADYSKLP